MEITQEIIDNTEEEVKRGFDPDKHVWLDKLISYTDYIEEEEYVTGATGEKLLDEDGNYVIKVTRTPVEKYKLRGYVSKPEPAKPFLSLSTINVTATTAKEVGNIIWIEENDPFTLTSTCEGLPDGQIMMMIEKVIDGNQPQDDIRLIVDVKDSNITVKGRFTSTGNYIITQERMNRGLERINAPFRLSFDKIEFDVYQSIV